MLRPDGENLKATKASGSLVDGIVPECVRLEPDQFYWLGPAQLSYVMLELMESGIGGAQRNPTATAAGRAKIAEMSRAMRAGAPFPNIELVLEEVDGVQYQFTPDGGHRCCASFMARLPVRVVTRYATAKERRMLFLGQKFARRLSTDDFVVDGDGPLDLYVQDALTSPLGLHPWADLVALKAGKGRLSPAGMAILVGMYGTNNVTATYSRINQADFNETHADELAALIHMFGGPQTNPSACSDKARRAIGKAAVYCVLRSDDHARALERWGHHMPSFRFALHAYLAPEALVDSLIDHWNKRLSAARRVYR